VNTLNVNVLLVVAGLIAVATIFLIGIARVRQGRSRAGWFNIGLALMLTVFSAALFAMSGRVGTLPFRPAAVATTTPSTRLVAQAATATITFTPSATVTALPTLTPAPTETDIVLVTPITYQFGADQGTQETNCRVMAVTLINLRGDPSLNQRGIGRVTAGSLLRVTGRTADAKWWRVINNENGISVEGWVSADFVKPGDDCMAQTVPVIGDSATPGGTPTPTVTPTIIMPTQAVTAAASVEATAAQTTCVLITTTAVSVRSDPSRQKAPLAQLPERQEVIAFGQTANRQWWHIRYTLNGVTNEGWIGAGAVLASRACADVPEDKSAS
jgi:hypothetical protein